MESNNEESTETTTPAPVRKTRSGRIVRPPPASKSPKTPGRKTRKKMVLMEVEVSDDEEPTQETESTQETEQSDDSPVKEEEATPNSKEKNEEPKSPVKKKKKLDDSAHVDNSKISALEEAVQDNIDELHKEDELNKEQEAEKMEVEKDEVKSKKKQEESEDESDSKEVTEVLENKVTSSVEMNNKQEKSTKEVTSSKEVEEKSSESNDVSVQDEEKMETDEIEADVQNEKNEKDEDEEASSGEENEVTEADASKDDIELNDKNEQSEEKEDDVELNDKNEQSEEKEGDVESNDKNEQSEEKEEPDESKNEADSDSEEDDKKSEDGSKKIETESKESEIKKEETEGSKNDETPVEKTEEAVEKKSEVQQQNGDPDAENISEDELPGVQVAKVPETEEVSDEELPGPKRAELPADTEVVSEDELPTVKKEGGTKRKIAGDYDPGSPTSENGTPSKKPLLEVAAEKEKEEKPKPKKLPELDKYWKAVNDDPTDFTGWTYLLQYVDQENDMEAAREAYDAFLSHYPYCYGYWRKYADYEKRKGNKKKCEEVFERGFKAIPLSVDLWIHYMTYCKTTRQDDEEFIRSQFERAVGACGLEFRSDRLWDSYIKWETEGKRLQRITSIYDKLLATPTQGYTTHFDNFQEHIQSNPPNKAVEVDEFLALRKEVRHILKHDANAEPAADNVDAPPGDEDSSKMISTDEETKSIRERIISIRRKIHKNTATAVTARWNFEEGIKRPYFHVKPLERCQLKNWQDYLDFEIQHGNRTRIVVLFERCLIACALYEEFWLKFVHYLENLKDPEVQPKIRDVYERACTIHHLKKPSLHLQWAVFEESIQNFNKAAEILVNLEKSVPNVLQIAYRRINLERRRGDHEKCSQLYEHYMNNSKNKLISSNIAIKYSRFCLKILKNTQKATEVLKNAITKDPNNARLYLQLIDLTLQAEGIPEKEVTELIDSFIVKEGTDPEQKILFAQRKLEFLEDFGSDIQAVQKAYEDYQKYIKQSKEAAKKKEIKSEPPAQKKDSKPTPPSSTSNTYGNYGNYGNSSQGNYQYSGSQGQYGQYGQYPQSDQYQYQGWQYPQGNYGGYNQWGSYGGGYGY